MSQTPTCERLQKITGGDGSQSPHHQSPHHQVDSEANRKRRTSVPVAEPVRPSTSDQMQQDVTANPSPDAGEARTSVWRGPLAGTPQFAQRLLSLHNAGQHEQVIAGIKASLLAGYAEPWMYEVLALSLKLAGHPKEEIERVLLSRIDFAATDIPNMLVSAAYLTRFGGDTQALHLYRQASQLDPTRPEPYALGLKLAKQQHDLDAVRWAVTGILTHVWTRDYPRWHRVAESAAADVERELRAAGKTTEADAVHQAVVEAQRRDLTLRLTWIGDGDLDMTVEEPLGTVCSFEMPRTRSGGIFLHDGYGPSSDRCYETYVCPVAASGNYRIHVKYMSGNIVGKRARLLVVRYSGTPKEITRTHTVQLDMPDKILRVSLKQGRRHELGAPRVGGNSPVFRRSHSGIARRRRTMTRIDPEARRAATAFARAHHNSASQHASAVGFQPVISILSEGVTSTALAVVSGDRRYVRVSVSPTFTAISDVFTFSFQNGGNVVSGPGPGSRPGRAGPSGRAPAAPRP